MTKKYKEFYVSVDIESTGPIPGEYSMSSVGAFIAGARLIDGTFEKFDHEDESNVFYTELLPISSKYIPEAINVGFLEGFDDSIPDPDGSRHFDWMLEHGEAPDVAMQNFSDFVKTAEETLGCRAVLMAYPLSFDWMFVYWYFMRFIDSSPFAFSRAIDMKTAFSVGANKPLTQSTKRYMPKSLFSDLPHTHKASDDAIEQGIMGMNILERYSV